MSKIITKVEYDAAGNSFAAAVDLGEIKNNSAHEPSTFEDEQNTRAEVQWAGEMNQYSVQCFDLTKRAALRALFVAGTRIDVRITFSDGTTESVLSVLPYVGQVVNSFTAGQKATWLFRFKKFTSS